MAKWVRLGSIDHGGTDPLAARFGTRKTVEISRKHVKLGAWRGWT